MAGRDLVCCGDVSVAQCVAMQLLYATPMDSSTLAEQTGVTKGAVTRLVEGLDKRGWIKKKADKDDGRRFVLSLSAAGQKRARALEALTEATVHALFERIPKNRHDQVRESLRLLRTAAEQVSFPC
ncbi:MAG: DNA-binding MarR family transcriptional regulator [Polyangiales bacterium]|jgi:DNA-binding MarR family transcriptional regulator